MFDCECIVNNITFYRCCLVEETAKYAKKVKLGIKCPDSIKKHIMFRQSLLKQLFCVNWNDPNLTDECLTEEQLQTMLDYLKANCKDCSVCD